jgi:catechol 2,3-dioxygenase-like lactoylglutathione lyase family enzyme
VNYRLNHFGLLCQDLQQSLTTYQHHFGNQLTARWYNRSLLDIAFLGSGSDVTIELVGRPFLDYEETHIAQHGHSINHISFLVEDAEAAFEELKRQGVKVAWEPIDVMMMCQCGFRDPDGLLFEVFSYPDPNMPLAGPDLGAPVGPTSLRMHHISLLTLDIERAKRFYLEVMGLKPVYEYRQGAGGFMFLADLYFDKKDHNFLLEIIWGPEGMEPREIVMLEKHGACYDHLCYVAEDVQGAWQAAQQRGAPNMADPVQAYGMWIAWLKDADGNDVEIMNPLPE